MKGETTPALRDTRRAPGEHVGTYWECHGQGREGSWPSSPYLFEGAGELIARVPGALADQAGEQGSDLLRPQGAQCIVEHELGEEQLMAAHGTSYPPGQLHCARLVHIPQSSEHLQGWRVLGAGRRLPRQPPSPALPPTSTRWGYSGSSSSDWSDSRKCSRSISFWICIRSRSFRYCEEPRARACEPPP